LEQMQSIFRPEEICRTHIRENAKLAESPAIKLDVFRHAPGSRGAHDYEALAVELTTDGFVR
ncbi:MAG: ParA family protein, partial [Casimicrobiaceae bacterium]